MSVVEDIATMEFDEQSDHTEPSLTNILGKSSSTDTTAGTSDGYESMSDDDDKHQNPMAVYLSKMSGTRFEYSEGFSLFLRDAGDMQFQLRCAPFLAPWLGKKIDTREDLDKAKRFLFCK